MSIYTRCPHCETYFRVTREQLQVSSGQVRCGRCQKIFDAFASLTSQVPALPAKSESLAPLERRAFARGPDTAWPASSPAAILARNNSSLDIAPGYVGPRTQSGLPVDEILDDGPGPASSPDVQMFDVGANEANSMDREIIDVNRLESDLIDSNVTYTEAFDADEEHAEDEVAVRDEGGPHEAGSLDFTHDDSIEREEPYEQEESEELDGDNDEKDATEVDEAEPAIEGVAERVADEAAADERVDQPPQAEVLTLPDNLFGPAAAPPPVTRSRWQWTAGSAVLGIALAMQLLLAFASDLAGKVPQLRDPLTAACDWLGCTVALPRIPDQLFIETSDLQVLDSTRPHEVLLTATIRNRAGTTQALPWLELTLTDALNQTTARKVFFPADYLDKSQNVVQGIGSNEEIAVKLYLDTGNVKPAGYRLYLFFT